jgi:hypothetical protein
LHSVQAALAVLVLSSWGVGEGCGCQTFSPPEGSTKIGERDLYIEGEKVSSLPAGSSDPRAPVIVDIKGYKTSPQSFSMNFDIESYYDIKFVYLDFGADGIYKAAVTEAVGAGVDEPPTACGIAAEQQGITCTQACLKACGCLSACPSEQIELNVEQSCALNCTLYDNQGLLEGAPYNGSEKTFAAAIYKGMYGLTGLASQAMCSASSCAAAPDPSKKNKRSWSLNFSTPSVPELVPLSASMCQQDTSTPVATSSGFAKGEVKVCDMPLAADACFL